MYCDVWAGLSVRMPSPSALEGVGVARGLSRGHFVCRRHAASKPSHFIARGLVNQPCWWAHRSSEARGLVTQPWAHHSCMLAWPLHVDHVGLDVHDVSMGAGMCGGTLVHTEGLPFNKGNDGRPRESRDVEYHCVGAWNIYVMQHISAAVGYFKTRLVGGGPIEPCMGSSRIYALQSYLKCVSAGPCAPGEYIWLRGVVHGIRRLLVDTASCPLAFARHQID